MEKKAVSGIMLTLVLIGMLTLAFNIQPVKAQETVRFYVWNSATGDNIYPGKPYPYVSFVEVWVESPVAWDNTPNGIVAYTLSLQVDPAVVEVLAALIWPDYDSDGVSDGFLGAFLSRYGYNQLGYITFFLGGTVNKPAGTITGTAEAILGFTTLGVGAGGGPYPLMRFVIRTQSGVSETSYSPLDLFDCFYSTVDGTKHAVDIVDGGLYEVAPSPLRPVAVINAPEERYVKETVTFDGSDSYDPDGGAIVSYLWDFGDGTTSTEQNPIHTYTSNRTYEVTLVVTDDEEQESDPSTHIIKIKSPIEGIQELIETIKSWNLYKGTENSLISKLEEAVHLLSMSAPKWISNPWSAKQKLSDFINQVEALRSKGKLEHWQADYLIAEVQRIIDIIW